jgi:hypothetical protein
MANEIISCLEMCNREGTSLQRGMNFGLGGDHSVVLMSARPNAPYRDQLEDNGTTLIYEGHDEPRSEAVLEPKAGALKIIEEGSNGSHESHRSRQVRLDRRARATKYRETDSRG